MFGLFLPCAWLPAVGTSLNTFLLVTIIASVYDLLKRSLSSFAPDLRYRTSWLALMALFIVFADNALFNVASYKPDLIGVPLLIELIHIVLFPDKPDKTPRHWYFFLVASLIIAYKLTYLPHVAILLAIYFIRNHKNFGRAEWFLLPLSRFLLPLIFAAYSQMVTGSPIFPLYNKLFRSPYYPNANFKDERWGPKSIYEIIAYPFITCLDNARCSEFGLFSFRLLFGYIGSWIALICYRVSKNRPTPLFQLLFYVSALALLFDYACLVTTGYYRYAGAHRRIAVWPCAGSMAAQPAIPRGEPPPS